VANHSSRLPGDFHGGCREVAEIYVSEFLSVTVARN
jgi:hypothetical protein